MTVHRGPQEPCFRVTLPRETEVSKPHSGDTTRRQNGVGPSLQLASKISETYSV